MGMMKSVTHPVTNSVQFSAAALLDQDQKSGGGFAGLLGGLQKGTGQKPDPQNGRKTLSGFEEPERKETPAKSIPQNAETNVASLMILPAVQQQNRMKEAGTTNSNVVDSVQNVPADKVPEQPQKTDTSTAGKAVDGADHGEGQPANTSAESGASPEGVPTAEENEQLAGLPDVSVSEVPDLEVSLSEALVSEAQDASSSDMNLLALQGLLEVDPDVRAETEELQNQQTIVKEMAVELTSAIITSDAAFTSGDLLDGDTDQSSSDQKFSSQMMASQVHGQSKKESSATTSMVNGENRVRQEVSDQVSQQIRERLTQHELKAGNQQIKLTLSPENLGELKMNLNLQGQKLSVEIITENRMVRDAIRQNTDALKESLARQNITMESFDVTTGEKGAGSGNRGQNSDAWQELANRQQQQQFWTSNRGFQVAQAGLPPGHLAYLKQDGYSMLDVHY